MIPEAHSLRELDVLILVGGKGTRLQTVVNDRPKPMADMNGRPFLDILIEYVATFGFDRFILCAGSKADYLTQYYSTHRLPHEIIISAENSVLGTGGAIKNAENLIRTDTFLVMNGDSFCPVDLTSFYEFHQKANAQVSITVVHSNQTSEYGCINIDDSKRVTSFEEKKQHSQLAYINAGIYLFNRSILSEFSPGINFSLEKEFFPSILKKNFFAHIIEGEVLDIGTPERYKYVKRILADR